MRQLSLPLFLLFAVTFSVGCKSKPETKGSNEQLIKEMPEEKTRVNKEASEALVQKALESVASRDWRNAERYYGAAIKNDPDNWRLYMDRAIAQSKVPDFLGAISTMRQALEKGGEREWVAWFNLGNIYQNRGMYYESIQAYRVAHGLTTEPNLDILVNISSGYIFLGQYDEAQETLSYILSIEPQELRALHNEAMILHLQREYDKALLAYDAVLAIDSSFAQSHFNKGHAFTALKRFREGAAAYERYLQIEPDGPYATRAKTRAEALRKEGN